jgi:pilus assembly protein CpaB
MNPVRIVIIVVAGVLAIGLALFVRNVVARPKAPPAAVAQAAAAPPMARVLVAKTDLAVGDTLSPDNMTWQDWPATTLNPAYITDGGAPAPPPAGAQAALTNASRTVTDIASNGGPKLQAMVGGIVREEIAAGEPITAKKIVRSGDSSYMAVRLPPGTRAVSLPLTIESGAGGFIQPGDRVDILSTHADASKTGGGGMVTETVLANVPVLAIDQKTDSVRGGTSMPGAVITVQVPAANVATVARARAEGGLMLALRSYADLSGATVGPGAADTHTVRVFKGAGSAELVTAQ